LKNTSKNKEISRGSKARPGDITSEGLFPVNARAPRQSRSIETRGRIAAAAIRVLADHGLAGLTHRLVAKEAQVSPALTTYHHATKFDIIAESSNFILLTYLAGLRRVRDRCLAKPSSAQTLGEFSSRLVANVALRHRTSAIAWAEIMLDAARHEETGALARDWFAELLSIWSDIARIKGMDDPREEARGAIDLVIGLYFMTIALGLSEAEVNAVLRDGSNPMLHWRREAPPARAVPKARTGKSERTRDQIVAATIALLVAEGPAAVSFRSVAAAAGLTTSALRYYFEDIGALLAAAQVRLFDDCKARYRAMMQDIGTSDATEKSTAQLTAAIFIREATEFGKSNLANYTVWIEASRRPEIRAMIWNSIADMCAGWNRLLTKLLGRPAPRAALAAQALFIGKLVRILASGSRTACLAQVPDEFARDLSLSRLAAFDG